VQVNTLQSTRWLPLALAALGAVLLLMAGLGTRIGLWSFGTGFTVLRWAAYIGIAAVLLGVLMLVLLRPRGATLASLGAAVLIGVVTFALPWQQRRTAQQVPPIHDITTDLGNPPEFVAVLPLRADAPNSTIYAGEEIAAQQRAAYPDIAPLFLETSTSAVFTQALDAARSMGWEIVAADSSVGRIEATATTPWFGFKDDVVVRITADGSRTRVDVRSVSRVGRSDVGANAARIRKYLARLQP
jgi:uncharacterized protein (DUF1499 family)